MAATLLKHGIHVDNFQFDSIEKVNLFLLTHGHSDHSKSSLKRFKPMVYCSYLTSLLINHKPVIYLVPNQWYEVNKIHFYVFETVHCPGGLGFFFPDLGILHLGDSRISPSLLTLFKELKPQIILYDNTHSYYKGMFPSIETSSMLLNSVIKEELEEKKKPTIRLCVPHIGALLLLHLLHLKVKPEIDSLKPHVLIMLEALKLRDDKSPVIIVGMKADNIEIMPSSQYFVINKLDPNHIVFDKAKNNLIRLFASFHAGFSEISLLSDYKLESLHSDDN
jgi:hypothetical protein